MEILGWFALGLAIVCGACGIFLGGYAIHLDRKWFGGARQR